MMCFHHVKITLKIGFCVAVMIAYSLHFDVHIELQLGASSWVHLSLLAWIIRQTKNENSCLHMKQCVNDFDYVHLCSFNCLLAFHSVFISSHFMSVWICFPSCLSAGIMSKIVRKKKKRSSHLLPWFMLLCRRLGIGWWLTVTWSSALSSLHTGFFAPWPIDVVD